MKIIAIMSSANLGKTSSIQMAIPGFDLLVSFLGGRVNYIHNTSTLVVMETSSSKLRVGFAPHGDMGSIVSTNIRDAITHDCDILVTATRTKGDPADDIIRHCKASTGDEVLWFSPVMSKWLPPNSIDDHANGFRRLNAMTAKQIINVIEHVATYIPKSIP